PLPVSARITSSTRSPTDARHRGKASSSSFTIMHKLTVINALSPFMYREGSSPSPGWSAPGGQVPVPGHRELDVAVDEGVPGAHHLQGGGGGVHLEGGHKGQVGHVAGGLEGVLGRGPGELRPVYLGVDPHV